MSERYLTRVICKVHSHIQREGNGIIDCSADIVSFRTSKSIKGTGGMTFTLLPRNNYLNLLFPDDVVNLYVDTNADDQGFVRLFFGYIDRIERTEQVDDKGAMRTAFSITCTDFAKAIDKTEVYFNPHLANRAEFTNNDLGLSQLGGGHALRTKGITAHGTPAQFVENLLQLLLGFGTQWTLPASYPTSNFLQEARSARRQRAKSQLPAQLKNTLRDQFGIDVENIGLNDDIQSALIQKQFQLNTDITKGGVANFQDYIAKQAALSELLTANVDLQAYQMALQETESNSPASILDILSLDFIEALTVDGFISSSSVWTNQGGLASILYGWSNEIVNELCFDLRPVVVDADDQCFGTQYSREADDLGINANGTNTMPATTQAVQYVPAVIFREYPYSTVEGLDLSHYYIMGEPTTFTPFGPIFAMEPNVAGRKIYNYQNAGFDALTPEKCYYDNQGAPLKHLDVVTIVDTDVTGSSLGRSDQDIFNLFELYSTDVLQQNWKYLLNDILPVLTPVSIARHGLRLHQLTTKFANYARDQLCSAGSSAVDSGAIRRNLIRWALLIDQWYQHNPEYLSGTITMRGRPDVRVGYRLDWKTRNESYYVEKVDQQWEILKPLITSVQVSRGQRNDPFPAYIPPILSKTGKGPAGAPSQPSTASPTVLSETDQQALLRLQSNQLAVQGGGNRGETGRLADYFYIRDTRATTNAVGGNANYSAQNDVDIADNIDGAAEFPGESATREDGINPTQTLIDLGKPRQGGS